MISRRQIRIKVMQAIYVWYRTGHESAVTLDIKLMQFADDIRDNDKIKDNKGDYRLIFELFNDT